MVKTNQFVRIQNWESSFSDFSIESQLPVITMDRQHVAQFGGYVLKACIGHGEFSKPDKDLSCSLFDRMCTFVPLFQLALLILDMCTNAISQ